MAMKRVVGQNDRQDYKEVHLECGHSQNFHKGDTVDGLIPCYMCDGAPGVDRKNFSSLWVFLASISLGCSVLGIPVVVFAIVAGKDPTEIQFETVYLCSVAISLVWCGLVIRHAP
jgi:hypothetical protein